ncbi:hypothetical protein [Nitrospirillum sp. BR 11163]|uniref:hypothetical protein n=1 Tax=Nitrospirillum sp. BR 11163 TaxID=3104323 RepID=UPI002AFE5EFC|nr:hypothetical protein [Nitrospirillum sp. BR 11163]MEA1673117.1 hypothetical protein [Nitrospirillum sp. BR 11163]
MAMKSCKPDEGSTIGDWPIFLMALAPRTDPGMGTPSMDFRRMDGFGKKYHSRQLPKAPVTLTNPVQSTPDAIDVLIADSIYVIDLLEYVERS